jgi:hypothetical protein
MDDEPDWPETVADTMAVPFARAVTRPSESTRTTPASVVLQEV